ncbi:hypothetical protein O181_073033 [Austropuccinia psidii MF-1]|uniref:Uncharacterized protein n=1 Tax=Austropuccinia psidii MF-1 TaxID=1389203 RepID=A0A9Q3I9P3_9BASI|nr:hypothetical protein [Austropuccinia psidii MF-1]
MFTLAWHPQDMPLHLLMAPLCHLPSSHPPCALPTCLQSHPQTGLISNTAYHPYAPVAPSKYASDASTLSLPSPLITPLHLHRLTC